MVFMSAIEMTLNKLPLVNGLSRAKSLSSLARNHKRALGVSYRASGYDNFKIISSIAKKSVNFFSFCDNK